MHLVAATVVRLVGPLAHELASQDQVWEGSPSDPSAPCQAAVVSSAGTAQPRRSDPLHGHAAPVDTGRPCNGTQPPERGSNPRTTPCGRCRGHPCVRSGAGNLQNLWRTGCSDPSRRVTFDLPGFPSGSWTRSPRPRPVMRDRIGNMALTCTNRFQKRDLDRPRWCITHPMMQKFTTCGQFCGSPTERSRGTA